MRKKNSFTALNIINLHNLHYVIIISQPHVLSDLTISFTKQEQEETEEESKTCSGKIINI